MKIAIISDSHDNWLNIEKAVAKANAAGCEYLLFAGDLSAPPMVPYLAKFKGKVLMVWGNNENEKIGMQGQVSKYPNLTMQQDFVETTLDGVRIFMNHYPKFATLAAKSGDYDLTIYGHTHHYDEKQVGSCLLLNPGELAGYSTGKITMVIYDTKTRKPERIDL